MRLLLFFQAGGGVVSPEEVGAEQTISNLVLWLRLGVEALGAAVIGAGILVAAYVILNTFRSSSQYSYNQIRLTFARFLAVALEFQLAADILSTAVAPSWDQIGKLAAIAVIRTALNYFLTQEIREERTIIGESVLRGQPTPRIEEPFGRRAMAPFQEEEAAAGGQTEKESG